MSIMVICCKLQSYTKTKIFHFGLILMQSSFPFHRFCYCCKMKYYNITYHKLSFIDWYNQYLIIIKLLCRAYNNASKPSLYPHSHFTPPHKNHLFMSCRYHNEYWIYRTLSCEYILWSKFRITLDGPPLKPFILSKWVGGHLEILVSARVVMICYWLPTCASRIPSIVCYRGIAMRLKETRNVYYKHPQFEFNSLLRIVHHCVIKRCFVVSSSSA